jgi:hypothetical protein
MCNENWIVEFAENKKLENIEYLNYLKKYPIPESPLERHLILLLAAYPEKLKEKFFELYDFDNEVNVLCISRMDDKFRKQIILEINEILITI